MNTYEQSTIKAAIANRFFLSIAQNNFINDVDQLSKFTNLDDFTKTRLDVISKKLRTQNVNIAEVI